MDLACHAQSIVPVPLYDTLGADAVEYIVKHAELEGIACSAKVFPTLAQCLPHCPNVKLVVRPLCLRAAHRSSSGEVSASGDCVSGTQSSSRQQGGEPPSNVEQHMLPTALRGSLYQPQPGREDGPARSTTAGGTPQLSSAQLSTPASWTAAWGSFVDYSLGAGQQTLQPLPAM